jgi:hypothetical protein
MCRYVLDISSSSSSSCYSILILTRSFFCCHYNSSSSILACHNSHIIALLMDKLFSQVSCCYFWILFSYIASTKRAQLVRYKNMIGMLYFDKQTNYFIHYFHSFCVFANDSICTKDRD